MPLIRYPNYLPDITISVNALCFPSTDLCSSTDDSSQGDMVHHRYAIHMKAYGHMLMYICAARRCNTPVSTYGVHRSSSCCISFHTRIILRLHSAFLHMEVPSPENHIDISQLMSKGTEGMVLHGIQTGNDGDHLQKENIYPLTSEIVI